MKIPSASYVRRDILFTTALVLGTVLLMSFRPEKSLDQKEAILNGTLNEMGGAEFVPQGNPRKPYAYIDVARATDGGYDVSFRISNLLPVDYAEYNELHLAQGYAYLLVNGEPWGRIYGEKVHLPAFEDGEHLLSVYFEMPNGGLFRVLNKPIGNTVKLVVDDGSFKVLPF